MLIVVLFIVFCSHLVSPFKVMLNGVHSLQRWRRHHIIGGKSDRADMVEKMT